MATYITLVNYTQKGIENIKDSPARGDAFKQLCAKHGAELKGIYRTMGRYDVVAIVEAPDDKTITKLNLSVASAGNVRTETLRAFSESEYRDIIAGLS